jgi:hypothetical protein
MEKNSTRTMDAQVVLAACERYVDKLNKKLMALQEPLIEKAMRPRLLGLVAGRTREEAKQYLGHGHWNRYNMARLQFDWATQHVLALRKLCLAPGVNNHVTITAEDAEVLSEYFQ